MFASFAEFTRDCWQRCRLWLVAGFISVYLAVLGFGLFCHTFNWNVSAHPGMYYIVWDMFCGWSAFDTRYHVLAEGVSGQYYKVLPGPWGEFYPYGALGRRHYDTDGIHATRFAMNVLRHTSHEDITRMFVVEETWAKKFNLPDQQWADRWDVPKDPHRYFTPRHIVTADGNLLQTYACFHSQKTNQAIYANPRLAQEASRSTPYFVSQSRPNGFGLSNILADSNAIRGDSPVDN